MTSDEKADAAIKTMVMAVIGGAVVPTHINWAITAAALGSGVVAIGLCYGVELSKDEGWHLVKQFVGAAGFWFMGLMVGTRILSVILATTGVGYAGAVALDATISAALAYAIGASSKAYFKGVKDKKDLGAIFRKSFQESKARLISTKDAGGKVTA